MVNFADIANDMEMNNVLNLDEMTSVEDIDAAVDIYSKDLFSEQPFNLPVSNASDKQVNSVNLKPFVKEKSSNVIGNHSQVNSHSSIEYVDEADTLVPSRGLELISMLLNLKPKFIGVDDEFTRILNVSKRVLSGGGKVKRGKPATGCARRMFSGLFLYAAQEISPLSKAIYSLERMFANSGLYDLLSEKDLHTIYIDDIDIVTEKLYDPHFTNLTVNGIIFSVYYTSNGM